MWPKILQAGQEASPTGQGDEGMYACTQQRREGLCAYAEGGPLSTQRNRLEESECA